MSQPASGAGLPKVDVSPSQLALVTGSSMVAVQTFKEPRKMMIDDTKPCSCVKHSVESSFVLKWLLHKRATRSNGMDTGRASTNATHHGGTATSQRKQTMIGQGAETKQRKTMQHATQNQCHVYAISTLVHMVTAVKSLLWHTSLFVYLGSSMEKKHVWLLGR